MASSLTWTLPGSRPAAPVALPITHAMTAVDSRPLEELSERDLVEACRAGRPGAFDLVVERHRRAVYLLCYRFVASHEDASDLSQDVFLKMMLTRYGGFGYGYILKHFVPRLKRHGLDQAAISVGLPQSPQVRHLPTLAARPLERRPGRLGRWWRCRHVHVSLSG